MAQSDPEILVQWRDLLTRLRGFFQQPSKRAIVPLLIAIIVAGSAALNLVPDFIKSGTFKLLGFAPLKPYTFPFKTNPNLERWDASWPAGESGSRGKVACEEYRGVKPGGRLMFQLGDAGKLTDFEAEFQLVLQGSEESASWLIRSDDDGRNGYLFRLTYPTESAPATFQGFRVKGGEMSPICKDNRKLYSGRISRSHLLGVKVVIAGESAMTRFMLTQNAARFPCRGNPLSCCGPQSEAEEDQLELSRHPEEDEPRLVQCPLGREPEGGTIGFRAETSALLFNNFTLHPAGDK